MGLLDGLFGKDEINQLQQQLLEKNQEFVRLSSQLAEQNGIRITLQSELTKQGQIVEELKVSLRKAAEQIRLLQQEIANSASTLAALRVSAASQQQNDSELIASLQSTLQEAKAYVAAANSERDEKVAELLSAQIAFQEKDRIFIDRELKLAEKSEKLQSECHKFQQQATELHTREQEWKHRIEPMIAQYNAHLSLDEKKQRLEELQSALAEREKSLLQLDTELIRRKASDAALSERENEIKEWEDLLSSKQASLDARSDNLNAIESVLQVRSNKLESWARELFVFQSRVDKLDAEAEKLASNRDALQRGKIAQQEKHVERLAEIRELRADITKDQRVLNQRELTLSAREKEVKRDEKSHIDTKNKNFALRNQVKDLKAQLEDLSENDQERDQIQSELEALSEEFEETKSAFLHPTVLSWLIKDGDYENANINNGWVGLSGSGPWEQASYKSSLKELGYTFYPLSDDDHQCIIVGRVGWSATELRNLIDAHQGQSLRIYSQEMFLTKLATGRDPFDEGDIELLEAFAEDHPALQFLMALPDPWPDISDSLADDVVVVEPGSYGGVSQSPLNILDYHAGRTANQSASMRRSIIVQCFESRHLPFSDDSSDEYKEQWGRSRSAQRLYRIALHLKILADGQGKVPSKHQARLDWISDSCVFRRT